MSDGLQPYPDGRWWVVDHLPTAQFPLVSRGNTGEVYPNVVTPLTGSIVNVPFLEGQAALSLEFGLATKEARLAAERAETRDHVRSSLPRRCSPSISSRMHSPTRRRSPAS